MSELSGLHCTKTPILVKSSSLTTARLSTEPTLLGITMIRLDEKQGENHSLIRNWFYLSMFVCWLSSSSRVSNCFHRKAKEPRWCIHIKTQCLFGYKFKCSCYYVLLFPIALDKDVPRQITNKNWFAQRGAIQLWELLDGKLDKALWSTRINLLSLIFLVVVAPQWQLPRPPAVPLSVSCSACSI